MACAGFAALSFSGRKRLFRPDGGNGAFSLLPGFPEGRQGFSCECRQWRGSRKEAVASIGRAGRIEEKSGGCAVFSGERRHDRRMRPERMGDGHARPLFMAAIQYRPSVRCRADRSVWPVRRYRLRWPPFPVIRRRFPDFLSRLCRKIHHVECRMCIGVAPCGDGGSPHGATQSPDKEGCGARAP